MLSWVSYGPPQFSASSRWHSLNSLQMVDGDDSNEEEEKEEN